MRKTALHLFAAGVALFGTLYAQTIDRTKPPVTPAAPDYKLPATFETKLPNGLNITLVEDRRFPLVTVRLGFLAGTKYDPQNMAGVSETVAALLTEGTRTRTSRQLADEVASIGGRLSGSSTADGIVLGGSALAEHTGSLLELLADAARNASFPEDELKLRIQNRKQELALQRSQSSFLAAEKMDALIYGSNPYGRRAPTPASLDRIDRKALVEFQNTRLVPNNAFLVMMGRLPSRAETLRIIKDAFGGWKQAALPEMKVAAFPKPARETALVDRPGSVQADILVGRIGITRSDPDFFPLLVANTILGGSASARMFLDIREKRGFAYDAHSQLDLRRDAGAVEAVTQVRNEVIAPAMQAVLDNMTAMAKEDVSAEELAQVKNYLSGLYLLRLETQAGVAQQLITLKLMGLPNSYLEQYTARVRAVTAQQVRAAANRYINPENANIVVVGDAAKIAQPLEKYGRFTLTKAQ